MPRMDGRRAGPAFVVVYGTEGVGKSKFAASAPGAGVVDLHRGTLHLQIPIRYVPSRKLTWRVALDEIRACAADPDVQTVVVDGVDDLEPCIWDEVVADAAKRPQRDKPAPTNIEEVGGGWQAGLKVAVNWWGHLLGLVDEIMARGKHVVFTCHATRRKFKNPGGEDFDRWSPSVDERAAVMLRNKAEAVLFAQQVAGIEFHYGKKRAKLAEDRVLETRRTAGWDAKNRINLPQQLPLSWDAFWRAREAYYASGRAALDTDLEEQLAEALEQLPEGPMRTHVGTGKPLLEYAREHPDEAPVILNWILHTLGEEAREREHQEREDTSGPGGESGAPDTDPEGPGTTNAEPAPETGAAPEAPPKPERRTAPATMGASDPPPTSGAGKATTKPASGIKRPKAKGTA